MSYTPGPWTVEIEDGESRTISIPEIGRCLHDSEWAEPEEWERDLANARLIAAAPELLEAVKAMQLACDEWAAEFTQKTREINWAVVNDAYIKASNAIAKAEGK
jgi:hypothetical protein